ncbi:hypothetical protein MFMK1_003585 [Metallumcola ferriviriculae]|uniref:Uncharacterized protein n=1 Tax=Metallumcola ferriviriculae TaxID=3039180 RepID=A0AAU0UTS9_9FIRM|nr:hypothetical protein MFMK1_003585 [Desulfitibacteraceae bacterium MK1]
MTSDSLKRFTGYLTYTLLIIFLMYWGMGIQRELRMAVGAKPALDRIYLNILFRIFHPVIIGLLLAAPGFIRELRKPGRRGYDWAKFLAIGIPMAYITMIPLIYVTQLFPKLDAVLPGFHSRIMDFSVLHIVSGVIFGYLILGAYHKRRSE